MHSTSSKDKHEHNILTLGLWSRLPAIRNNVVFILQLIVAVPVMCVFSEQSLGGQCVTPALPFL